jgi:thiamine biosynthesis lipoprotein ApbE
MLKMFCKKKKNVSFIREKEEHRQRMISYLGSLLKQQTTDEEFRIAKAIELNEAKRAKEEFEKMTKQQKEVNEINEYRLNTVRMR